MEYGSIFDARSNAGFTAENVDFLKSDWQLYRSGRDALKALARIAGRQRVLLPDLCCASMIRPFTLNGYEVEFYRLRKDLRGDEEQLRTLAQKGDLLLYMPYFGVRPFADDFLKELRKKGVLLAEDRTQDIVVPREDGGFVPDATVASLRKWACLPEGGMLQTTLGSCPAREDPAFGDQCREAMEKKADYMKSWEPVLKEAFLAQYHRAEELLDADGEPVVMSGTYREIAARLDFGAVYEARLRNVLHLQKELRPLRDAGKLDFLSETPEASCLYLPILLEDRDAVQRAMAERKVYCPVIWPQPAEVTNPGAASRRVTQHMLALPIDQRYSNLETDYFCDCLMQILNSGMGEGSK